MGQFDENLKCWTVFVSSVFLIFKSKNKYTFDCNMIRSKIIFFFSLMMCDTDVIGFHSKDKIFLISSMY